MNNMFIVIMAGGAGTRFWPKSRKRFPKQFLSLFGNQTMLQMTANRFTRLVDQSNISIVSTGDQVPHIREQLPWISSDNLILEPVGKNTAPCIALSALHLQQIDPDAVMVVAPSDHLITHTDRFVTVMQDAVKTVLENPSALVTLGIAPTYPSTGYGYIQKGISIDTERGVYKVRTFAEKPDYETAVKFLSTNEFLWNSGIFVWKVSTIIDHFRELMPDVWQSMEIIGKSFGAQDHDRVTNHEYRQLVAQSIDYGILEKASQVIVIESDFGWSDVGSWEEVYKISDKDPHGNVIRGEPLLKNVHNSYIETNKRQISIIGIDNIIVVDTDDALLICKKELSQEVKWVTEQIKQGGKEEQLL